jgi:hypothetical protein
MAPLAQPTLGAGWFPSPDGRGQRWWDGASWTDHWVEAARNGALIDARSPGQRLHDALSHGWRPQPCPSFIDLSSTEQVYAHAAVEVLQLDGGDEAGFLRATPVSPVVGWQPVDHGTAHMTTSRFALQLSRQFGNVPYAAIADATCDVDGVCLWMVDRAPVKLRVVDPEWHFVLFRWLAYAEPRPFAASAG